MNQESIDFLNGTISAENILSVLILLFFLCIAAFFVARDKHKNGKLHFDRKKLPTWKRIALFICGLLIMAVILAPVVHGLSLCKTEAMAVALVAIFMLGMVLMFIPMFIYFFILGLYLVVASYTGYFVDTRGTI